MPRRIKENLLFSKSGTIGRKDLMKQHLFHKDDMREARRLYKLLSSLMFTSKKSLSNIHSNFFKPFSTQQKCVIKLRFGNDKDKHSSFLQEYLTQQKKNDIIEKPELFSSIDSESYIEQYQSKMVDKHFKFIISPESQKVDCKALVKTLIARMEKITGLKFDWISSIHTNTEHIHAHLLINGIDKSGKDVNCFKGTFLKQTIREMCSQICTELVGVRTREQIESSIKKLPTANRYCVLDKQIELFTVAYNDNSIPEFSEKIISRDDTMYQRLCFLSEIGFAKKVKGVPDAFLLEKDWNLKLKTAGKYNAYLKARNSLLFTAASDLQLFSSETKEEFSGIVTKVFVMNDEDSWDNAIVVENRISGKAIYIPLYGEPNNKLQNAQVRCIPTINSEGRFKPTIKVTHLGKEFNN